MIEIEKLCCVGIAEGLLINLKNQKGRIDMMETQCSKTIEAELGWYLTRQDSLVPRRRYFALSPLKCLDFFVGTQVS